MLCCYLLRLRGMWSSTSAGYMLTVSSSKDHDGHHSHQNPTEYFDIAVYFFDSTFMLFLFLHFGRRRSAVKDLFEELQSRSRGNLPQFPRKVGTSVKCYMIFRASGELSDLFADTNAKHNYSANLSLNGGSQVLGDCG
jgi:hypothetical protein